MALERKTPLRAKPRSKGNRAEREIVDLLRAHGWTGARRNWQSGGQRRKTKTPAPVERPAGLFTNRHGYTLRRCDCGTAVLPDHDRCVVCAFNADTDEGETA